MLRYTLAHLALYKDFSRAVIVLSREQQAEDPGAEAFIRYDHFVLNWDQVFGAVQGCHAGVNDSSRLAGGPITKAELKCYRQLAALGFKFTDLIKYDDFHE